MNRKPETSSGEACVAIGRLREAVLRILDLPDIPAVLEDLRKTLGTNAAYPNLAEGRTWIASSSPSFKENVRLYPTEELKRLYPVFPVQERETSLGFLILEEDACPRSPRGITPEETLVDVTLRAIRLLLRSPEERPRQEEEQHEALWSLILEDPMGNGRVIREQLRSLGFPMDQEVLALAFSLWNPRDNRSPTDLEPWGYRSFTLRLRAFFRASLFSRREGTLACAVACQPRQETATVWKNIGYAFEAARKELPREIRAYLGVGSAKGTILALGDSYGEARMALAYIQGGEESLALWDRLGDYKVLGFVATGEPARCFCGEWLGRILEFDRINQTRYLETLRTLERHNWNLAKTAESMSYHVNSVKYRHRKIEEILGRETEDPDVRFNLALSLRLLRYAAILRFPETPSYSKEVAP